MKLCMLILALLIFNSKNLCNGVGVVDATNGIYLQLINSTVDVSVDNQVAIITVTQTFKNNLSTDKNVKFAFPLPEGASATGLQWQVNGIWYNAAFKPGPQDTTLPGPGGQIHPSLFNYLGEAPLYFNIEQVINKDSLLTVKLTYVELLKYEFGIVKFWYPNDYQLIQTSSVNHQELIFYLSSQRNIDSISLKSHLPLVNNNYGDSAFVHFEVNEAPANSDYELEYSLSLNQLGLFSMSTTLVDSLVPDSLGKGYFLFIAEPNPSQQTEVIKKVFTLIIDRSGSMSGNKMQQAKSAASYIVQNLNEGDKFNLIDFDDQITSFRNEHVPFNDDNKNAALQYISTLFARGLTNISGSFGTAISQFNSTNDSTANIIIFLTDGQATAGLTYTNDILNYVRQQVNQRDTTITIFNFGIGNDANRQLLTLLATEHSGIAEFLDNDEVEERITLFYNKIRNPVLLNTQISFSPFNVIETYPDPLPNLYKGQQLLVSGRYSEAAPVTVTLSGSAFGQPVSYNYQLNLSDSTVSKYQFLTKIWAKLKIEYLLVVYYSLDPGSAQANTIKDQIINISILYGVLSPFTNLSGGDPTGILEESGRNYSNILTDFELLGNFPNPFNPGTKIMFKVNKDLFEVVTIRIYNTLGELVRVLEVFVNRSGIFEVYWDGNTDNGITAPSGNYIYVISAGNTVLAGKMNLLK